MTMTISRQDSLNSIDVSAYAPRPPIVHHEPLKVAEGTYLIRQTFGEGEAPQFVYVNSLVILGEQPAIVDTGTVGNRENWLNDVFSLVDPKDVKWIFLSHDDHDHVGNLLEALALCPNATLISSWFQGERLSGDLSMPLDRMIWLEDGATFDAGDRVFAAIRPPLYDSPTTRGLFDPKTGVYWAVDAFATSMTEAVEDVSGLNPEEWRQGFSMFNVGNSPWVQLVDAVKYNATINRIAELDPKVIVSAHTPTIPGSYVRTALDMLYDLPQQPYPQFPGQAELEAIRAHVMG